MGNLQEKTLMRELSLKKFMGISKVAMVQFVFQIAIISLMVCIVVYV